MNISSIQSDLPKQLLSSLEIRKLTTFLPAQQKAIEAGLLDTNQNILICTPTASGKTLIAEIAATKSIYEKIGKAIYIVPLKALATEKYKEFKERYPDLNVALSIGETDSADNYLSKYDWVVTTSEKLDSEIRHDASWLKDVKVVIIDEIHLLTDPGRGPTLEILITILKELLKGIRIIGLSATIGNPQEFAKWLDAKLVLDTWRPVELQKGIYLDGKTEFYK